MWLVHSLGLANLLSSIIITMSWGPRDACQPPILTYDTGLIVTHTCSLLHNSSALVGSHRQWQASTCMSHLQCRWMCSPHTYPPPPTHTAGRHCVLLGAHWRRLSTPWSPRLLDLQICRAPWHSVHGTTPQDSPNIISPCVASQHNHPACWLGLHEVIYSCYCSHSGSQLCSACCHVWLLCTDCTLSPSWVHLEEAHHTNANDPVCDSNRPWHLRLSLPWILYLFNFVWSGHAVSLL